MNKAIKSEKGGEGLSKDTWEYLPVARSIQQACWCQGLDEED